MSYNSQLRLEQLTGLRYFAALLVYVSHIRWDNSAEYIKAVFGSGYVGVSFFFVLSGFVLAYSYQDKIANGKITFTKYMYLRFARLTPLHFVTLMPFIGLALYTDKVNPVILLANFSYLQSWFPHSSVYFSFNAPSWSLSNEMFFYFCFFFIAAMPFRVLLSIAFGLLALITLCALVVTIFFNGYKIFGSSNTIAHWMFYIFPGFRVLEFLCGMIMFYFWKSGRIKKLNLIVPAYLFLILAMYFADYIPEAFRMSLFFLPVIMLFLLAHLEGDGLVNSFFKTKAMILLGNASFSFYLIHQPVIHVFRRLLNSFNFSDFNFFMISLTATTALSISIYLTYEKWAERKLQQISYRM